MSTITHHSSVTPPPLLQALAKSWWLVLLRGIAGIVFGILAFTWPGITLAALVLLYGAYALADGIFALATALTGGEKLVPTWWLVLVGLAGIAAGLVTFLWPGLTALILVYFIGAWAIVHGVFEIVGAIKLRKEIEGEWWLVLAGLLSVIFGLVILVAPGPGALGLIWVIGAYSIAFGVMLVALSFRLRSHRRA
jgi:uncharacterized membrane protein HdeD (DUF308 family)